MSERGARHVRPLRPASAGGIVCHMNRHSDETPSGDTCETTIVDAGAVARVQGALAGNTRLGETVALFAAFADKTRFTILTALSHGELCVCDLAQIADVSQSGVSHQLRVLREHDLVTFRREGKRAVYRLADDHVEALIRAATEHVAEEPRERQ